MVKRSLQVFKFFIIMKVSTVKEKSTDKECLRGSMVNNTMETGKKANFTVLESFVNKMDSY